MFFLGAHLAERLFIADDKAASVLDDGVLSTVPSLFNA